MITTIFLRSEYFKTALDTAVGEEKKFVEVKEGPHPVLATVGKFIYGTEKPDYLNLDALIDILILILILIS